MPDNKYPPYPDDSGALLLPRTLQRWLDVNPQGGALRRVDSYIISNYYDVGDGTHPEFEIVTTINFVSPNNLSLRVGQLTGGAYALCVAYELAGLVYRYLIQDVAAGNPSITTRLSITPYVGQKLLKNFRLEAWTQYNSSERLGNDTIYTSVKGNVDYRYETDFELAQGTANDSFNQTSGGAPWAFPIFWSQASTVPSND